MPLTPAIEPERPLISVMIPVYNRVEYLPETLRSILTQDPGRERMQIEVLDDCSTLSDPEAMVRGIVGDRVSYFRQPRNVGLVENFNACIRRARGDWVHILHSDDAVRPGFYARASEAIAASPTVDAWFCRVIYMNADGLWTGLSEIEAATPGILPGDFAERMLVGQRIQFAGILVRRAIYEELGGFRPELKLDMDWDMWKQIALRGRIFHDPTPLALFRVHDGSAGAQAARSGEVIADRRRSIRIASSYVPRQHARRLRRAALRNTGIYAIREAERCWPAGERAAARRLLYEAVRSSRAPAVLGRGLVAVLRMTARSRR